MGCCGGSNNQNNKPMKEWGYVIYQEIYGKLYNRVL